MIKVSTFVAYRMLHASFSTMYAEKLVCSLISIKRTIGFQWRWWLNFDVGDSLWILDQDSWCPKCESWWSKWPRPSSTSYSCYQNISYPSSVTNIDVTKNRGRWIMFENKYFIVYCGVKFLFRQNKIIILAVVMIKVIISPMHALSFMLPTWIGFKCYSYEFLKFWIFFYFDYVIRFAIGIKFESNLYKYKLLYGNQLCFLVCHQQYLLQHQESPNGLFVPNRSILLYCKLNSNSSFWNDFR